MSNWIASKSHRNHNFNAIQKHDLLAHFFCLGTFIFYLAPSAQLSEFMKQTLELEKTAQQIFNNSVDFFSVMVDGVKHTHATVTSGLLVTPTVQCPSGTIKLDVFCGNYKTVLWFLLINN